MIAPGRRKRNAPPSPPWEKPKVCIKTANGQAGQNSNSKSGSDSKTNSGTESGGEARKKRSTNEPNENEDAVEQPAVNKDFSSYAEFLQLFMELPTDVRHDIGHLLGPVNFSTLGEKISGLIVGCTYKGGSCMGQK